MKRIIATIVATAALFFSLAGTGAGSGSRHRIAPLRLSVAAGRTAQACTGHISANWQVVVWVSADRRNLASSGAAISAWTVYYAGNGTLVRLRSHSGNGPICAKVTTWLPMADVRVRFTVL